MKLCNLKLFLAFSFQLIWNVPEREREERITAILAFVCQNCQENDVDKEFDEEKFPKHFTSPLYSHLKKKVCNGRHETEDWGTHCDRGILSFPPPTDCSQSPLFLSFQVLKFFSYLLYLNLVRKYFPFFYVLNVLY